MSPIPPKAELLAIIDDEKAQWDALVEGVPFAQMTAAPLFGDWTFRDLAAHLLAWREWGLTRLDAAARNQPKPAPPYPDTMQDVDEVNAFFHERDLNRSAEDVTTAFSASFERLRELVAKLPETDLADPGKFPYLDGVALGAALADRTFFEHIHDEHGPDIAIWREQIGRG